MMLISISEIEIQCIESTKLLEGTSVGQEQNITCCQNER